MLSNPGNIKQLWTRINQAFPFGKFIFIAARDRKDRPRVSLGSDSIRRKFEEGMCDDCTPLLMDVRICEIR
jgi:hypothetical protein